MKGRAAPAERLLRSFEGRGASLPRRWERLGDVLVLPFLDVEPEQEPVVAAAYARELGCRAVLVRHGRIQGSTRAPSLRHVWGDTDTRTTVTQHGVRYRFDPMRVMFSAGNLEERARMGRVAKAGETVVDLFAGLGYLSLPMAVHSKPGRVVACEINPQAHAFLGENARLNGVDGFYEARPGDNRMVAPRGVADRVVMGYLHGTHGYLGVAAASLKPDGGVIHYHYKDGIEFWPDAVWETARNALAAHGRPARLASWRRVKSYAPRVIHGVLDIEVGPAS